jgi:hypothetical protein
MSSRSKTAALAFSAILLALVVLVRRDAARPPQFAASTDALQVRVLVLNFDPLIAGAGNRRLHDVLGWHDPRRLHPLRGGRVA